jgi:hypothetical protein
VAGRIAVEHVPGELIVEADADVLTLRDLHARVAGEHLVHAPPVLADARVGE